MMTHKKEKLSENGDARNITENCENFYEQLAHDELNETPENYTEGVKAMRRYIADCPNLMIPKDEEFIVRFLRARKFDNEKAFNMLQRYFLMKQKYPELCKCPLPSEANQVLESQAQLLLSDRDQFGRKVFVIRVDKFDSSRMTMDNIFQTNLLVLEDAVRETNTQIAGIVIILDMAGFSLHHARFFTPYYAKRTVEVVQETFPLRFKGFHIINEPFYFDAVMAVLRPFIKDKIRKRIYLHGNNLTSLHTFVPPDILPSEYGGLCKSFDNRQWHTKLLAEENYFRELEEYGFKSGNINEN